MNQGATICAAVWLGLIMALAAPAAAGTTGITENVTAQTSAPSLLDRLAERFPPLEINGYVETRAGMRTRNDPDEKGVSVAEATLQLEMFTYTDWADFKFKGDLRTDGVTESVVFDTREAWIFSRPSDNVDIKVGRQVLTWGTGGLVFLNDMFPKDWQSFFIGRDAEYLKAPCNSAKVGLFSHLANVDLVYTPRFEPDRYINGEYISYWSAADGERLGNDDILEVDTPNDWFEDDEFAMRVYRNVNNYELALYGYWGYWKDPKGVNDQGTATFPKLNTYGASVRGQVGPGIGNAEFAYYDSTQSNGGTNADVHNSQMRYVVGYGQEVWANCTLDLQYYVEQMLDYGEYRDRTTTGRPKDEFRHVITVQLSQLFMNQTLTLALDGYCSPSDEDAYLRPSAEYKISDTTVASVGANIFFGNHPETFFGQFSNNSNIYTSIRYSF
ncbi:hypothetical protein [Pseudodesulfovibrio senegalensis]|uniref:Porin n=1 Tax=Pseudodesulfovibrio senegalensis TaxID=1721087 RepID=A0A6N6N5G1_9BACT|nr:hypothetical protein [Pseudodesulfovibrio senegalensis]KAB1443294.1 hypothetical protein F8A88_03245 [Pseudodesulfovibrio senegalensis]